MLLTKRNEFEISGIYIGQSDRLQKPTFINSQENGIIV